MAAGHPVLVAEDTSESAREMLRAVARGGGVLVVQLVAAPVVEGPHVLELSRSGEPTERFLAEPVAAPCDLGFPLRLAPYVDTTTPSIVPDLAFDSLPPRRTDAPSSAPPNVHELPSSGMNLGGWLMPGSSGQQAGGVRDLDDAWLAELSLLEDIETFKNETVAIVAPVGKLLRYGDAHKLSAVITTMRAIIKKENGVGRAKYAGRVLRFLRDPSRLVAFVDAALGGAEEPSQALKHVLLETQAAAAEALCAGRLRHRGELARARFVTLTRRIGPAATPSLTTALGTCLTRGERMGDLVEDLLRAIPPVADEPAGAVIVELLRGRPMATTTSAALAVLPYVWIERARPFLSSALAHPDPNVALVAANGLRHLDSALV